MKTFEKLNSADSVFGLKNFSALTAKKERNLKLQQFRFLQTIFYNSLVGGSHGDSVVWGEKFNVPEWF